NKLSIDVVNKGSADANGVIITISNDNDNTAENLAPVTRSSPTKSVQQINSTSSTPDNTTSATTISSTDDGNIDNNSTTGSSSITTVGTQKFDVGVIGPNQIVSIDPSIYPA